MIKKLQSADISWPDQVKLAMYAIRSTLNRSTGFSPFQIVYGQNRRSPLDLVLQEFHEPIAIRNVKVIE